MNPGHGGGATGQRTLVVGIGSPDRADDAVGPAVVGLLAERRAVEALGGRGRRPPIPADVRFMVLHDPTRLVDEMGSCDLLVLVDAMVGVAGAAGAGAAPPGGPVAAPLGTAAEVTLGEPGTAAEVAVGEPGTVATFETGSGQPPLPTLAEPRAAGTHGMGVGEAIELGRALGRLPARVVVVAIAAGEVTAGAPMSAAASAAIPLAARCVLDVLVDAAAGGDPDPTAPPPWLPHPSGAPEPPKP
ncbi:MAG TPA: hypothetical protein VF143_07070 [Candidatus Nanopelagicales bacterium]